MSLEFVIEKCQRDVVEQNVSRIEELFKVHISLEIGTAEKVWITLKGEQVEKAKCYVKALTSPEEENDVTIPDALIKILGPRTDEHSRLEKEYGVHIRFEQDTKAIIVGSAMDVMLASSKLEDLISNASPVKASVSKPAQPKANRALEEFALKLGYEQGQVNAVFEKLGPTVDRNTFLNALINISGPRSSVADDRRSPAPPRAAGSGWQNSGGLDPYARHAPSEMVVPKGNVQAGRLGGLNGPRYDSRVVARGVVPRNPTPSNGFPAMGFSSRDYVPTTHGYNGDLGMFALATDVVSRIPRNTVTTTQGNNPTVQTYSNRDWAENLPCSSDIIARGFIPRTTTQTTQGNNTTYSVPDWPEQIRNGPYVPQGNEYGPPNSDPQQVDQMVEQLVTAKYQQLPQSDLRHIVIDGSNVAMSHGNNKVFSCKGIALCVEWFRKRGHKQITVFVPTWRKESAKPDNPIIDQHILNQLEAQGFLTYTPSRKVKGRRIVCYDDRFIIRLAESTDGVIVSNDNFKDLASENPKWRDVIEQRLLMYSFVNDMFMPPDDPLGRHGPTLDEFLHKGTQTHRRVCPYGRRCTYGTRCKYHHPEREDYRLNIYQKLKGLFPNQDALILNVMKKFPNERDENKLASHVLNMMQ